MKESFIILTAILMSLSIMAQEKPKQKEIGITFMNLDNFGLTFKTGNEKSLWRFNTLLISGNNMDELSDSLDRKIRNIGFKIMMGKEWRKVIVKNFEMRYGVDLSFRYNSSDYEYNDKTINDYDRLDKSTIYEPGINLVFGFNYVLNDHLVIGAEVLPNFSYMTGTSTNTSFRDDNILESDVSGFNFGISNTSVLLSVAYRY